MSMKLLLAASVAVITTVSPAWAADTNFEILRAEVRAMQTAYESKIHELEQKMGALETKQPQTTVEKSSIPATSERRISNNSFNPEIGVILQGQYQSFSADTSEFSGFAVGEEAERGSEGFGLGESEINFSANVDDLFRGSATIALVEEGGGTEVEIEEVYVETISLPYGLQGKAGRFFSELGYLNSHHSHADDFSDRPLTNRAFLNGNYGDDGVQISAVLPTDIYSEIGGGVYRGDDFPGGGADGNDIGSWTAYGRVGGDVGDNTSWRVGLSTLQVKGGERSANEDMVVFNGDSGLYIADARMVYAPTGNNAEQEITLQGEYFHRKEDGTYDDMDAGTGAIAYNDSQSGWYAQSVYKFRPKWRLGARYSQLYAGDVPTALAGSALDSNGHNPWAASAMLDWTNSEFSRARVQFNHEELSDGNDDNQFIVQYIMSLGAHGAHAY